MATKAKRMRSAQGRQAQLDDVGSGLPHPPSSRRSRSVTSVNQSPRPLTMAGNMGWLRCVTAVSCSTGADVQA